MSTWWIWRLHPSPRRLLTDKRYPYGAVTIDLPLPYVRSDSGEIWSKKNIYPPSGFHDSDWNRSVKAWTQAFDAIKQWAWESYGASSSFVRRHIPHLFGSMLVVEVTEFYASSRTPQRARRRQRYDFMLTPPVHMFCDLTGVFEEKDIGPLTFWIQPEVFEATGEIMQGEPIGSPAAMQKYARFAVSMKDLQDAIGGRLVSDAQDRAAEIVRIALDSYLERGEADPRFLNRNELREMLD